MTYNLITIIVVQSSKNASTYLNKIKTQGERISTSDSVELLG